MPSSARARLQSLNVHLQSPKLGQLTSMHFYGWKKGLKTGMYYLRTRPAAQAIHFTVDQDVLNSVKQQTANTNTARTSTTTATVNGSKTLSRGPLSSHPVASPATWVQVKEEPVSGDSTLLRHNLIMHCGTVSNTVNIVAAHHKSIRGVYALHLTR